MFSLVKLTFSKIFIILYYCRISQMIYILMSEEDVGRQFSLYG